MIYFREIFGNNVVSFTLIFFTLLVPALCDPERRPFPTCRPGQSCVDSRGFSTTDQDAIRLETRALAEACGFRLETHKVVTRDEYILTIHRLVNPLITRRFQRGTVIIQHGILCSSSFWLMNSKPVQDRPQQAHLKRLKEYPTSNSLAIALANHGYDIWLTNFRGTQYGRRHRVKTVFDPKFWQFNIDSLIQYDFEAYVRYILDYTNSSSYTYIGHSLGATVGLGALIVHKDKPIIQKQTCSILLAPVASTQYMNSTLLPLLRMATLMYDDLAPFPGSYKQLALYARHICFLFPKLCSYVANTFVGLDKESLAEDMVGVSGTQNFNRKLDTFTMMMQQSISVQMLKQIMQAHNNGRLAKYDYGYMGNKDFYGSPVPPSYDLLNITAHYLKMSIIGARDDVISTKEEIDWIYERVVKVLDSVDFNMVETSPFNHMDLALSNVAGAVVNEDIISFIQEKRCFPSRYRY